jgi:hypothetical protein
MRRLPAEDRASEIFLPPMGQRDNTSGGIWSMGRGGSPVQITVGGPFDVFRGNGVHIFARDASLFGLQSKESEAKNHLYLPCLEENRFGNSQLGLLIRFILVPLVS